MRERQFRVHSLPMNVSEDELAGSTVVVIDLLRASSTICQALAAGAREVVPFVEVEATLAAAESAGRSDVVLGGERRGERINGFDLGNSPSEYTPAAVGGRRVFITTTNGTRALYHARRARRVIVGAFLNLSAVVASLGDEASVDILCAGTDGGETREDVLAAGAFVRRITEATERDWQLNDVARDACRAWDAVVATATAAGRSLNEQIALELRNTPGGRNLLDIGLDQDLVDCAQVDRLDVVPELDGRAWRICLPSG